MRVIAFWAAIAGLATAAGLGATAALPAIWPDGAGAMAAAELVARVGGAVFALLVAAYLLAVAVTDRKA